MQHYCHRPGQIIMLAIIFIIPLVIVANGGIGTYSRRILINILCQPMGMLVGGCAAVIIQGT